MVLFFVGMRISIISTAIITIFFLSGIIMGMSIVYVFETDHLYNAEILIIMFWLYFTHACLLYANSYFFFGIISILTILNRLEKRYNKDGKNKIMPVVLIALIAILFFYIKDNFNFHTFFYLAQNILE